MCLPAAGRREKNKGVAFAFLAAGFAFLLFWKIATFFLGARSGRALLFWEVATFFWDASRARALLFPAARGWLKSSVTPLRDYDLAHAGVLFLQ